MAEVIFDELIQENFTSRGNGVFELDGALTYRFPFSSATRANGDPIESGDLCPCTFVAAPNIRVSCLAVYTPGSPALLDATGGPFWKTSNVEGGLPDFGTKKGVVGLTMPAALQFYLTIGGSIANPFALRSALSPQTMKAFKAAQALAAGEAILAQSGNNTDAWSNDLLAGLMAAVTGETDAADEEDIFATASSGVKAVRRSIKAWRTYRGKAVAAGNYHALFNADKPGAVYGAYVFDEADPDVFAWLLTRGDESAPRPLDVIESPGLIFDRSGVSWRVQNAAGSDTTIGFSYGRLA